MSRGRVRESELMDDPGVDPRELRRGLRDLTHVNRWLRGTRLAVARVVDIATRVRTRPVAILDVGTGAADIPIALVRAARARGLEVRVTVVDLHDETLAHARAATASIPEIEVESADARSLPYPGWRFDIVMCGTMLHHLTEEDAALALSEFDRVSRWGMVVTDLARSDLALLGANLLAHTLWRRHAVTRHDGPASVRAAFTPRELDSVAGSVLDEYRVESDFPFRLALVVDRTPMSGERAASVRVG